MSLMAERSGVPNCRSEPFYRQSARYALPSNHILDP